MQWRDSRSASRGRCPLGGGLFPSLVLAAVTPLRVSSAGDGARAISTGRRGQPADPGALVIFGASGDLAKRKLFPALLNLRRSGLLRNELAVAGPLHLGDDERGLPRALTADLRTFAPQDVGLRALALARPARPTTSPATSARPTSTRGSPRAWRALEAEHGTRGNVVFYLATPPDFFGDIVDQLGRAGLTAEPGEAYRRVIIEKPFGNSYDRPAS